ncbi:MAG: hypothetical protein RMX96_19455 [Nostoc sp. ChiSLP02]|nr:hypothetical protein [Nostoc sp. DedSLP05]MDZ8098097.1 hypothetical protein [Nostoc sp. DedSLP01]MDZ8187011.1 hypothetical protein [Nostoc sp. ChiSLP02]
MANAELEGVIPPFIGYFVGWWIGEVVDCWLAGALAASSSSGENR